jgi:Tol biopolymer transport system component/tRNA A-37 threonylcarbamoyl transferase component Bud32
LTAVNSRLATALAGRYAIERELGQGGMATVYLARDVRHERQVALKVLRPELAASLGPERFLREIKLAAQLQHPHILPLHDSGEASGFLYYVMPYIEGETLRGRLARRGELPVHDAVKILIEIVDALAYAHEHGVVHRDVKPDNVLLSGRHALVTDFGVAKAVSEATGRQELTTAGVALGTPTYMAPEQAIADPGVDHRADIYAVGVVGYELIVGHPPFAGRPSQEILAAHVMQPPPPLCIQRPACPPALEAVIMRCLEKRPADRWQSADELLAQLEPLATPSGGTTPTMTRPVEALSGQPHRFASWRWVAAAGTFLAIGGALAVIFNRPPAELQLGRRAQLTLDPGLELDPAVSPDGKLVAYTAGPLGQTLLYVRQVEGATPVAITSADAGFARTPRWSPDGGRLLFHSQRGLEVVPALGGPAKLLVPVARAAWADGTWSPDGRSVAYAVGDSVHVRPAEGGAARGLARLPEVHSCAWSPDGRWIACTSGNRRFVGDDDFGNIAVSTVWIVPAAGGTPIRVTEGQSLNFGPAWLPGGRSFLYVSDRDGGRDIYRLALGRDGRPAGAPTRLTTGLDAAQVSVSADGRRLAYAAFSQTSNVWSLPVPGAGLSSVSRAEPVTRGSQVVENFDISPDRRWLAFDSDRTGVQQIYRMPLAGGAVEQLTSAGPAFVPQFSPDGREIAYHAFEGGTRQIFVIPAEGGTPIQLTTGSGHYWAPRWSPDGRALSIVKDPVTPDHETDLVTRDAGGRWGPPRTLVKGGNLAPWTPDGRAVVTAIGGFSAPLSLEAVNVADGERRVLLAVQDPARDVAPFSPYVCDWSDDGRVAYFIGRDPKDGILGVWGVPAAGGPLRPAVRFDDPARPWHQNGFSVHDGRFYFTLGDRQSDVWVTELLSP